MKEIEIKTERLTLRPLNISDLEAFYEYAADEENTKYMVYFPHHSIEETKAFLERVSAEWEKEHPDFYEFSIVLDGVQIGTATIYLEEGECSGELAWMLNKKYWHHGYATEAATAVKEYAVSELHLKELYAHCDCRNTSSARVMERLGMERECEQERVYSDERGTAGEYKYSLHLE
ncbi:MAG: GNAT family N-acetyltransferase [Lachnospiraceae bacterium]